MFRYFFEINGLPDGAGFRMFGAGHLLWLGAIAAAAAAGVRKYQRLALRRRKTVQHILCWSMVALDLFKDAYFILAGVFSYEFLPLHLCGMAIYLSLLNAYRPGRIKQELLYGLCMPGAAAALIFPAWTFYPIWNIATLQCFLIHALLLIYPLLLLASGEIRPRAENLRFCLLFLLIACPPVYVFNRIFGTNFMFLNSPPPAQPFLLFVRLFGNPGYLFGMFLLLLVAWALLYLPVVLVRLRGTKFAKNA